MRGTVDGFSYGAVTPVVAYLMACLGGGLGLRCTTRSLLVTHSKRPAWLALGAASIGSGMWTMHFVAMMGFTIRGTPVHYDMPIAFASLGLAVVMVGVGIFIVGYRGATGIPLFTGGTITGLGVASMHYLGMAGVRFDGWFTYNTLIVAASVVIAVVAASAALWAAGRVRGFLWSAGASLVMGLAASGMHYTGMAALSVHLDSHPHGTAGAPTVSVLGPVLIGPLVFLLLAGVVVLRDPLLIMGGSVGTSVEYKPGVPAASVALRPDRRPARHEARGSVGRPEHLGSRAPQSR
ncbi:hypothetical protein LK07_07800 [Streptomyces pluripotens]|uniref:MHYT domain-containing protein n=1 Tax=Streptomyces pluripotens TaxID=1355015 RepID=A0A221NVX4_9ACTN|nr:MULTISPECIES: MHYT domain-containing protein [Streptomyces]ARP69692.1 hypothetical protein LK06_006700 [Streptomyces pluripotens]ASN23948.1 hypothetical protein LK07_07800 [Streptomyces pluripotens]KIE24180.1 membrane protein [Streptomyces sp. MUSC 125]MCH0555875.1 hypothetical protein [Streptomyces sp. MUM 16J]